MSDQSKALFAKALTFNIVSFSLLAVSANAEVSDSEAVLFVAKPIVDVFISVMNLLFVAQIIILWYPKTNKEAFLFNAIIWPTEPLLVPVREQIPPAVGVDISAIVCIMLLNFLREILTGPQGVLTLIEKLL